MLKELIKLFETADVTIAAFIACAAALIALLQVKANIISTARIEWADKMRKLISELVSSSLELQQRVLLLKQESKGKNETQISDMLWGFKKENVNLVISIDQKARELVLHLNPNKKSNIDQIKLISMISSWRNGLDNLSGILQGSMWSKTEVEALVNEGRIVIKKAWDDAKTFKILELIRFSFK